MKTNLTQAIDEQIAMLERRKTVLSKLLAERAKIESQIEQVSRSGVVNIPTARIPTEKKRQLALPRGVITIAAFNALQGSKKPMTVEEVVEKVKESPLIKGSVPHDLERRVKGVLYTSEHFKAAGKGVFTNSKPALTGHLFNRLTATANQQVA